MSTIPIPGLPSDYQTGLTPEEAIDRIRRTTQGGLISGPQPAGLPGIASQGTSDIIQRPSLTFGQIAPPPEQATAAPSPGQISRYQISGPHPGISVPAADPGTAPIDYQRQRQDILEQQRFQRMQQARGELQQLEQPRTPFGQLGIGGKIGRVLSTVGNIAGEVIAPGVMQAIPGTWEQRGARIAGLQEELNQLQTQQTGEERAQAELTRAQREAGPGTAQEQTYNQLMRGGPDGGPLINPDTQNPYTALEAFQAVSKPPAAAALPEQAFRDLMVGADGQPRVNPDTNQPYTPFEAARAVWQAQQDVKPEKPDTQAQRKERVDEVTAKLDKARLPTDPKNLRRSLDLGLQRGIISPDEHAAVASFQTTDMVPATQLTVRVAGLDEQNRLALNKMFEGKEVIANVPGQGRVQMSYGDAQARGIPIEQMTVLGAKEAQDNRDRTSSVIATMGGLKTYRNDFKTIAPTLGSTDRNAMRVLTEQSENGHMANVLGGIFDDIPLVGPLGEYANRIARGTMTSDQYNQLSPSGKKLVNDYFNVLVGNFANMKAVLGSMGRNPAQIQAEINRVPLPYLDWESASGKFDLTRDDIRSRAASIPQILTK